MESNRGMPGASSLGAASQLGALKASRVAKGGDGAPEGAAEQVVRERIDLRNEQWQKPRMSHVAASAITCVVCIAVVIIAAFALNGHIG